MKDKNGSVEKSIAQELEDYTEDEWMFVNKLFEMSMSQKFGGIDISLDQYSEINSRPFLLPVSMLDGGLRNPMFMTSQHQQMKTWITWTRVKSLFIF